MSKLHGNGQSGGSKWLAAAESTAVTVIYLLVALGGLQLFDVSAALSWLAAGEAEVVSGFIVGSMSQIAAVTLIWLVLRPVDLASSFAATRVPPAQRGGPSRW